MSDSIEFLEVWFIFDEKLQPLNVYKATVTNQALFVNLSEPLPFLTQQKKNAINYTFKTVNLQMQKKEA